MVSGIDARLFNRIGLRLKLALILALVLSSFSAQASNAADIAFTTAPNPTISGVAQVGQVLTANTNTWNPAPTSYTYQWRRDGLAINNAVGSSYTLMGDDFGRSITVTVTGIRVGYISTARTSGGIFIGTRGNFVNPPVPLITGSEMVGESLFVSPGSWPDGTLLTYRWFANSIQIPGVTSINYILQQSDRGKIVAVEVTASRPGFNNFVQRVSTSKSILPATPIVTWEANLGTLTGKNTLRATAKRAGTSTNRINSWCITRNGAPLDLEISSKGVVFTDERNLIARVIRTSPGCYSSTIDDMFRLQLRVDVTTWAVGDHQLGLRATDTTGEVGTPSLLTVSVGRTAPVVTGRFSNLSSVLRGSVQISASSTTHSITAPISKWCLSINGMPVSRFSDVRFTNQAGSVQGTAFVATPDGCVASNSQNAALSNVDFFVDSTMFPNGSHRFTVRSISQDDEGTTWASTPVAGDFRIKNPYKPQVAWSSVIQRVVQVGTPSSIAGSITANIPGTPGGVTLSVQDEAGNWNEFWSGSGSNDFRASVRLSKNSDIKVEIFDEDRNMVYSDVVQVRVSPVVRLAKPRITLTGSTVSSAITKTVTLTATSRGVDGECVARWPGGSKAFNMKSGRGTVVFQPRSAGSVAVVCTPINMAVSKSVSIRY